MERQEDTSTTEPARLTSREVQRQELYAIIEQKTGEISDLFAFVKDTSSKDRDGFAESLAGFYQSLLAEYPPEIAQELDRLNYLAARQEERDKAFESLSPDELADNEELDAFTPEAAAEDQELLALSSDPIIGYLKSIEEFISNAVAMKARVERLAEDPNLHQYLARYLTHRLGLEPNEIQPTNYTLRKDGLNLFVHLDNKLSARLEESGNTGIHLPKTPINIISTQNKDQLRESEDHEAAHTYLELVSSVPSFSVGRIKASIRRLESIINSSGQKGQDDHIKYERQVLAKAIDIFFRLGAEEVVVESEKLQYSEPAFEIDFYLRTRLGLYLKQVGIMQHPEVMKIFQGRLDRYHEMAHQFSASVSALKSSGKDEMVRALFVLFGPLRTKRWEQTARHFAGDQAYEQAYRMISRSREIIGPD